ncbi:MAG TPA: hypothetical protein VFU14_02210 [Acidimicrobiales bacterium]|nr:hypothetical protein [Acidimicrobiales bacterium]
MVIAVRTEEADGGLVVVKEARSDGDVARLSREATMLARGRHPGVVDLVSVDERAIRLRHAGTALARLGPFPVDQAAGIVCAVADVVNALHRLGVVHGDVEPGHVLLDERGRPRLCGFGQAHDRTPEGAADDVAAVGRLLAGLLKTGGDLPWAHPPAGFRRRSRQRQARRELEAIAAQAVREQREQRPTARQLAKAVHAAVPGCSLPVPGSAERGPQPAFTELPSDIDPTADLGWTDADLSWLASQDDAGDDLADGPGGAGPYAGLGALGAVTLDDAPEDWAELAAHPEAVTGPLPILEPEPDPEPATRARIELTDAATPAAPGPSVPLPAHGSTAREAPRRRPVARLGALAAVLVVGVVGGAAGARAMRPLGSGAASATRSSATTAPARAEQPDAEAGPQAPASDPTWPSHCDVPDPAGPDVDGDGCPEPIELDGREARIGSVDVRLGDEGDLVALGDWDCDGVATPALLRPESGEVFVFPEWRLDEPLEVEAAAVVPRASAIAAGTGECPTLSVTTPEGNRAVELPS